MAGEDVIAQEVAEVQVPASHSAQGWGSVLLCCPPILPLPLSSFLHRAELQARLQGGVGDVRGGEGRHHRGVDLDDLSLLQLQRRPPLGLSPG